MKNNNNKQSSPRNEDNNVQCIAPVTWYHFKFEGERREINGPTKKFRLYMQPYFLFLSHLLSTRLRAPSIKLISSFCSLACRVRNAIWRVPLLSPALCESSLL